MEHVEILCGIAIVILALYYYSTSTFNFWKTRGVRGPRPVPIIGTIRDVFLFKKSMGDYLMEIYNLYKNEPMIGIFMGRIPILVVRDPELIKDVLIKDFSVFANRGIEMHEKAEPLEQHLFTLEPKRWRPLRTKLSPVFTSGKLKEMCSLISQCADHLEQYTGQLASANKPIECRELTAKYTTDVIGTCAFGIEMNALSNEDSEFRKIGREMFSTSWSNVIRQRITEDMPWIWDILWRIGLLPLTNYTKFFIRVVRETINYRDVNNVVRHDFIDMLRELKSHPDKLGDIELTDNLIAAQAFVFFAAGFETSSTTISNALYELAINPVVQDKLRNEIDQEYSKRDIDLTYDNVKKMDYLDKVFKETLRKYPPVTFLMRESIASYTFSGTEVTIPKGQKVWIPIYGIQLDPDIYPKPDVFDPERFSDEIKQTRHPMFFLPFGDGPRNCIGARFAVFQTKIGLVKLLRNYKFETCKETQIPYEHDPKAFFLAPKEGIYLKITKIERK